VYLFIVGLGGCLQQLGMPARKHYLYIKGNATGRPSGQPFAGLHTSVINLYCAPACFLLRYMLPSLPLRHLDKERRRRETCSTLLRTSTVTAAPAPSAAPLLLLCTPLRHRWSPTLLLPLLHHAAPLLPATASALRPASPDGVGTTVPTLGDRSLLATEELCKEKCRALARKPSGLTSFYGCGASMQTVEEAAPRYNASCKRTFQMFQMF